MTLYLTNTEYVKNLAKKKPLIIEKLVGGGLGIRNVYHVTQHFKCAFWMVVLSGGVKTEKTVIKKSAIRGVYS